MPDHDETASLAGDSTDGVTGTERARLDAIRTVLADPAVWERPDPQLEDHIVAAIAAEHGSGLPPETRSRRRFGRVIFGVAAALIIAAGVAVGLTRHPDDTALTYSAQLAGTPLAADASGQATLTRTTSGWRIELHGSGLPRRDGGDFYEAWLKNAAGVLVPIGTFNEPAEVTLWAGVSPADFPTLTVTQQQGNGNPASSGRVVLRGTAHR